MTQRVTLLLTVLLATLLLAGCGGQDTPVEQAEEEAGVEEVVEEETIEPTQAPPRDAEEAAADEAKRKAAKQAKDSPDSLPEYKVAEIRPGVAATDLPQAKAIVFVTDFKGKPYGQVVNGPALQSIADEIRADNPEYEMLVADFYSGTEQREDRLMGARYSFSGPDAENQFIADLQRYAAEAGVTDE